MSQSAYVCPRCGGPIQVGQEVCTQCGLRLDPASLANFQAQYSLPYPATGVPAPVAAALGPPVRRRANLAPWIIGTAIVLVLCCGAFGVFVATNGAQLFLGLAQDQGTTAGIVDQFMQAGVKNDPQAAFVLFSPASTTATRSSVSTLFSTRRDYFTDYKATKINNFRENSGTGGTTVYADGTVSYTSRADVGVIVQLVKDHNQWKLTSLQLSEGVGK